MIAQCQTLAPCVRDRKRCRLPFPIRAHRDRYICSSPLIAARSDCRAVDSTGIKAKGEGEWNARKHGGSKRRLWRKIHIEINEGTLEIRSIEASSSNIGPSRQNALQSPAGQKMRLCSLTFSTRSHQAKRSGVLRWTAPTIHADATMKLRLAMTMQLSRRAKTPNFGSLPFMV